MDFFLSFWRLSVHDYFWCRYEDCEGEDCGEENKDHQAESVHHLQCQGDRTTKQQSTNQSHHGGSLPLSCNIVVSLVLLYLVGNHQYLFVNLLNSK